MFNEKNNDQNVIAMIEDIRKGGDENLNDLTEEEKEDLERIQYETYIAKMHKLIYIKED